MTEAIDYGVCRLAVVSVRKEPDHGAEQITQLLFGDHYSVAEKTRNGYWMSIVIHADRSRGWVHTLQHHPITLEYFDQINSTEFRITTDVTSTLLYKKSPLAVVIGSIVPISNSELFKVEEQLAFNGDAKGLGQKRDAEFLKTIALKYLNAPFLPGGKSPFGIDDSGLVQMVFRICGYPLPREASLQAGEGKAINGFSNIKPGDLLVLSDDHAKDLKVGISLGENKVIHVMGHVTVDVADKAGMISSPGTALRMEQARRIMN